MNYPEIWLQFGLLELRNIQTMLKQTFHVTYVVSLMYFDL